MYLKTKKQGRWDIQKAGVLIQMVQQTLKRRQKK